MDVEMNDAPHTHIHVEKNSFVQVWLMLYTFFLLDTRIQTISHWASIMAIVCRSNCDFEFVELNMIHIEQSFTVRLFTFEFKTMCAQTMVIQIHIIKSTKSWQFCTERKQRESENKNNDEENNISAKYNERIEQISEKWEIKTELERAGVRENERERREKNKKNYDLFVVDGDADVL